MKDPAFLFYPNDWLGGTMGMTFEEKGCYIELLMMQFNRGPFSEAHAKQVLSICFDVAWPMLKQKFQTDGQVFWNERLQVEIEKRQRFTESRRLNAKRDKQQIEDNEHKHKHMLEHMGNRNINENENINKEEDEPKKVIHQVNTLELDALMVGSWGEWIDYRKKIRKPLKEISWKKAYHQLMEMSGGDASIAKKIINQSIANGWQGLFPLKNTHNGSKQITSDTQPSKSRYSGPLGDVDYDA